MSKYSKRIIVLCLVVSMIIGAVGCGRKPVGRAKAEKILEVGQGERFKIVLDCNDKTGYKWKLDEPLDEKIVKFVDKEFQLDPSVNSKNDGYEMWTFRAVGQGETKILLRSVRKWEKGYEPAGEEIFTVIVKQEGG